MARPLPPPSLSLPGRRATWPRAWGTCVLGPVPWGRPPQPWALSPRIRGRENPVRPSDCGEKLGGTTCPLGEQRSPCGGHCLPGARVSAGPSSPGPWGRPGPTAAVHQESVRFGFKWDTLILSFQWTSKPITVTSRRQRRPEEGGPVSLCRPPSWGPCPARHPRFRNLDTHATAVRQGHPAPPRQSGTCTLLRVAVWHGRSLVPSSPADALWYPCLKQTGAQRV